MARKVKISSVSISGVGQGDNHKQRAIENMLHWLDLASKDRPDIICLPETYTGLGCGGPKWFETREPIPGPSFDAVSTWAGKHKTYVILPMVRIKGRRSFNSAVLIDRKGQFIGAYDKIHPTIGEIKAGITPGKKAHVFDTDFGRIGFAICFDLNFRDVGEGLYRNGAEMVFFPSMYRGGLQLSIWAHDFHYWVVSATPGEQSAIVNPLGRVQLQSHAHGRVITREINLDSEVLHLDENMNRFEALKNKYGDQVELEIASPEAVFLMTCHHSRKTVQDIIREFKFETRDKYFSRANRIRSKALKRA